MSDLRTQGVIGRNAPTRRTKSVQQSDFSIAGLIGFFERRYKVAFEVNNIGEYQTIFGNQINSNWYGPDGVKGFFDNLAGSPGSLYIKSYVGNDGTNFDAVTATAQLDDQQTVAEKVLQIDSAYRENLEFSSSGNRTGYTITNGARFTTAVATAAGAGQTTVSLDSVIGIKVGDIVKLALATDEYRKITGIDENAKTISFTGALTNPLVVAQVVTVLGFRLRTYRQSTSGIVEEVDTDLGAIWCTTESEVQDFYVENVFATSSWIKASKLTTTPTNIEDTFPADVATVTYLASGSDGTSGTTVNQFSFDNSAFDGLPVRILSNIETANTDIQKALEVYCSSRDDTPVAVTSLLNDQDKDQLIEAGQGYQRSNDVFQVLLGSWVGVTDPFTTDPNAADRQVPASGHIMGVWIRTVAIKGIHYIPTKDVPLLGVNSVVDDSLGVVTNQIRTDIVNAGVNLIQQLTGVGIVLRNFNTPSTDIAVRFANGLFLRNFIKISAEDSLQLEENKPNTFNQVKTNRDAVNNFMLDLWLRGSTGQVPLGETFGQFQLDDGTLSSFEDSVEVNTDPPINTAQTLDAGEQNIEVFFRRPAPAGSIFIKVGISLA